MKLSVSFGETQLSYSEVADVNGLMERLIAFARRHQYENKRVGRDTLVMQKSSTWRMLTGLSASLRISASTEFGKTEVILRDYMKEFYMKQFIFLIAVLVTFSFFSTFSTGIDRLPSFWMLFFIGIFPVSGAFRQYRLMERVKAEVDSYFSERFGEAY